MGDGHCIKREVTEKVREDLLLWTQQEELDHLQELVALVHNCQKAELEKSPGLCRLNRGC